MWGAADVSRGRINKLHSNPPRNPGCQTPTLNWGILWLFPASFIQSVICPLTRTQFPRMGIMLGAVAELGII